MSADIVLLPAEAARETAGDAPVTAVTPARGAAAVMPAVAGELVDRVLGEFLALALICDLNGAWTSTAIAPASSTALTPWHVLRVAPPASTMPGTNDVRRLDGRRPVSRSAVLAVLLRIAGSRSRSCVPVLGCAVGGHRSGDLVSVGDVQSMQDLGHLCFYGA